MRRISTKVGALGAVVSLGVLRLQPEAAVSAITNAFCSPDTEVRNWAAASFRIWLMQYAEEATPIIRTLLSDPDARTRAVATNSLSTPPRKLPKDAKSPV